MPSSSSSFRPSIRDDALEETSFHALRAFVTEYIECIDDGYDPFNDVDDDDAQGKSAPTTTTTLTSSFWIPRDAFERPRNAIEAYVGAMASSSAFQRAFEETSGTLCEGGGACAGAEWWIQDVAWDEPPKLYHTDCDVRVEFEEGGEGMSGGYVSKRTFPEVASVLYIEGGERCGGLDAGATVVFDQTTSDDGDGNLCPKTPRSACACAPKANRLLLFGGDRWHGVLRGEAGFRGQRVTLLVNWWREKPSGARALTKRFVDERAVVAKAGALTRVKCHVESRGAYSNDAEDWEAQRLPRPRDGAILDDARLYAYE